MVLEIAQLGQPVLRQVARPIPPDRIESAEVQALIDEMRETLKAANGVGLAAPQVFRAERLFLAAILPPDSDEGPPGVEVFINPRIVESSGEKLSAWEGCLSFVELLVRVPRHEKVRVEYLDRTGTARQIEASGHPARVLQHEYDHLEGTLTIDRAESTLDIIKASEVSAFEAGETQP